MENPSIFQPPHWCIREFHAPAELGHEEIKDIVLAKDGSAWFATMGGGVTQIKDGMSVFYTKSGGLSSNNTDCLLEDSFGGIWVGTREGVSYIYQGTVSSFSLKNGCGIQDDLIDTIAMNSLGEVWFGTGNLNLFYFIPEQIVDRRPVGVWKHALQLEKGGSIRMIAFDAGDTLWAAVMGYGLCKIVENGSKNKEPWRMEVVPHERENWLHTSYDMFWGKDGDIWIGGGSTKIGCFLNEHTCNYFEAPHTVSALGEFNESIVLVGTYSNGLHLFEPQRERWKHIPLSSEHPQPYIECIRYASDGAYWIGTREGAYRVSKTAWESFSAIPGGQALRTRTLARSNDGVVYVVDGNEDLYRNVNYQWEKVVSLPVQNKIPPDFHAAHQSIASCGDSIFYGYNQDLRKEGLISRECMKITLGDRVAFEDIPLPDDFLLWSENAQLYVSQNSELWLRYEEGVSRWDGMQWHKQTPCENREMKNVFRIFEPLKGVFWILGRGWIEIWEEGKGRLLPLPSSYTDCADKWNRLFDAVEHEGAFWIATDRNGLLKYDGSQWTHLHHKDGLPGEGIQSLCSARDGTLWVGSARTGVSSFKDGRWITYGVDDGVPNAQVHSILEDGSGTIWIELEYNGVAYYRPAPGGPIVWIDSGTENMLPNERGVFSFEGRDRWNETRLNDLVYSWRIVGQRDGAVFLDWSPYSAVRAITTPRLHSGEYRFEVRAQDKNRNTSLAPAAFAFTVQPYFWTTPQFLVPIGISLFAAVLSLGLWYRKHVALQRSETKYRTLVEKDALTLLVNWDRSGRIVYCNECAERLFGVRPDSLSGKPVDRWLVGGFSDSLSVFQETVEKAFVNPDVPQECRLRTNAGGRDIWISWFFRAVSPASRKTIEIQAVGVDITQQVTTEKALMLEKMSFRQFCDSVQIGMMQLNPDGDILYVNPAMQNIAGLSEEADPLEIAWRNAESFRLFFDCILHSSKPVTQLMEGVRADRGSSFFVYLSGLVKDGRVEILALDFTEQKNLEQRLAMASSREQERLGRELHDGLGQRMTSLAYLGSLLERKSRDMDAGTVELIRKLNADLQISVQQTRDLSKSLYPASLDRCGLRAALEELIQTFQSTYRTEIVLNWDDGRIAIDKTHCIHLYRIVREASFNALKHAKANRIAIEAVSTDDRLCVSISDDGVGISKPSVDNQSKGMGLSIMEYHARLIGCNLAITRNPWGGTTVKCTF